MAPIPVIVLLRRALREKAARAELRQVLRQRLAHAVPRMLRPAPRLRVELGGSHLGPEVKSTERLSFSHGGARWTVGPRAMVVLTGEVRRASRVTLEIRQAFGPNVGKPLVVRLGGRVFHHVLGPGQQTISAKLCRADRGGVDRIELEIPEPASPSQLGLGNDDRLLGVELCGFEVKARP